MAGGVVIAPGVPRLPPGAFIQTARFLSRLRHAEIKARSGSDGKPGRWAFPGGIFLVAQVSTPSPGSMAKMSSSRLDVSTRTAPADSPGTTRIAPTVPPGGATLLRPAGPST